MMNTKYANATGGTPIISWIPNQIEAVLNYIHALVDAIGTHGDGNEQFIKIRDELPAKDALLTQQLEELKSIDYNVQVCMCVCVRIYMYVCVSCFIIPPILSTVLI